MNIQHFDFNQQSNNFSIASQQGTPLSSCLKEVKHLNMELKSNQIEIQLNVEGLCGKNYKLEIIEDDLVLTALRLVVKSSSKSRNNSFGSYRWVTSTYVLPYPVDDSEIKCELKGNILHIYLSRSTAR